VLSEFKDFLKEKNFTYLNSVELSLQGLEKNINSQKDKDIFNPPLQELKKVIQKAKENDFTNSLDYIKRAIKREIMIGLYGEKGYYEEVLLKTDPVVKKASEVLSNKAEYRKLLKG
jgi:hypothetical protein